MLVEAMLLPSGNDAAYVLAAAAGRKLLAEEDPSAKEAVQAFLEEMNRVAEEVGLTGSHFENPDGYHSENHYTCPGDLATIGELALKNETIVEFMKLQQDSVVFASGEIITWYNTNRLLNPESAWYCENAIGMKTGYTKEAGYCLLAAFQEDDRQFLVGIFDSENKLSRYTDAITLFEAIKAPAED
jgi:D-alanyl-D-alanine carboxypeptidase (penicillin-binding protein 5/6)